MKKTSLIIATVLTTSLLTPTAFSQTTVSYAQTIAAIKTFDSEKHFTEATNGVLLAVVLDGLIENQPTTLSEGLKKRLVSNLSATALKKEIAVAEDADMGQMLDLLCHTKATVPTFIEDTTLLAKVGGKKGNGKALVKAIENAWQGRGITTNMYESFEGFDPASATALVITVTKPWFTPSPSDYEATDSSWASQSLQQIYTDAQTVDLAQKSVVVKLLAQMGYIAIPTSTEAVFEYSGRPTITIPLPTVEFSKTDVPELQKLASNPYYGTAAQQELANLGY